MKYLQYIATWDICVKGNSMLYLLIQSLMKISSIIVFKFFSYLHLDINFYYFFPRAEWPWQMKPYLHTQWHKFYADILFSVVSETAAFAYAWDFILPLFKSICSWVQDFYCHW